MALQPKSSPGLPFWVFLTITFLRDWIVSLAPNPQPGGPGLRIYDPWGRVAQLYPQALGTHFSRLLRHECVTVGLFFNPCHHMGICLYYLQLKEIAIGRIPRISPSRKTLLQLQVMEHSMFYSKSPHCEYRASDYTLGIRDLEGTVVNW
jgi:hypothetical protein